MGWKSKSNKINIKFFIYSLCDNSELQLPSYETGMVISDFKGYFYDY